MERKYMQIDWVPNAPWPGLFDERSGIASLKIFLGGANFDFGLESRMGRVGRVSAPLPEIKHPSNYSKTWL